MIQMKEILRDLDGKPVRFQKCRSRRGVRFGKMLDSQEKEKRLEKLRKEFKRLENSVSSFGNTYQKNRQIQEYLETWGNEKYDLLVAWDKIWRSMGDIERTLRTHKP